MVMTPPGWKMKMFMLQAELMLLNAKKKDSRTTVRGGRKTAQGNSSAFEYKVLSVTSLA